MAHPEVKAEKAQGGTIRSVTVRWLESKGHGVIGTMLKRSIWQTPANTFRDTYRELTINADGSLVAGNGLPLDGNNGTQNIPAVKPPKLLDCRFQDIDRVLFDRTSRWWSGREIPDHFLTLVRHDGKPIHLSWSMLGPSHFQPVVTTLDEVFERMRSLIDDKVAQARRSPLDDIFGDS